MIAADDAVDGVLPVDKPPGPSSHDIVSRVRRAAGTRRVGHTGTLDPFASGLLLVCIGRATRIAEYLSGMDKRYLATVRLGISTDTDDATGTVLRERPAGAVTTAAIEVALQNLRGEIMQRPSSYSAKKVGGERAYALARRGETVTLDPVAVTISELRVTRQELPELDLVVTCSSGTYIRALARDMGEWLGVGAHLTALRRTAVGTHDIAGALTLEQLDSGVQAVRDALIPTLDALGTMPRVQLSDADVDHIRHGRPLLRDGTAEGVVALAAGGELVAIAEAGAGRISPRKVFL